MVGSAVLAGCGSTAGKQLLVAEDTGNEAGTSKVWAVPPGDPLDSDSIVAAAASQPIDVITADSLTQYRVNQLGVGWKDSTLLAFSDGTEARVTAGVPGEKPATLASAQDLQAVLLNRGALTLDSEGCTLASAPDDEAERVGTGQCTFSDDGIWVVSWSDGTLRTRNLSNGTTTKVSGLTVLGAVVVDADDRVLAVEQTDGGKLRGRMIDATDGSTVATTPEFDQVSSLSAGGDQFVIGGLRRGRTELASVDTAGTFTVIDTAEASAQDEPGSIFIPVAVEHDVTYLRINVADPAGGALLRWTGDPKPEVLLRGNIGAGQVEPGQVVATREGDGKVEFYREDPTGMQKVLTLRTPTDESIQVDRFLYSGDSVLMTVTSAQGTSLVRLDLEGEGSDAPIRDRAFLALDAIDNDGTLLLSSSTGDRGGNRPPHPPSR